MAMPEALAQVASFLADESAQGAGRLPSLRKGMRLSIRSHTPWFGKRYDLVGVVEVTPRTVRSGAVMARLRVEEGTVEGEVGARRVSGKSLWVPWSPAYIRARITA